MERAEGNERGTSSDEMGEGSSDIGCCGVVVEQFVCCAGCDNKSED